jgi:HAD superfamily hydrolase (TIGR01484 family)
MQDQYKLVIATDLDGTFLEGDHRVKNSFYTELLRLRDTILLVYTTGRSVETVKQFCEHGHLPYPHFIIGDHGTEIAEGTSFKQITELQEPIIKKWNNGGNKLKALLQHEEGLTLQPINPPYRVAYYYDPSHFQDQTLEKIINAGFDFIQSCEMYLDIVPKGVNKGSSLLNILTHLNMNNEIVITCGDSLNDLSLFQTGLKSIAVGNSEPKLVSEIKQLNNVYHSSFPGLLGILDGLRFYKQTHFFTPSLFVKESKETQWLRI